MKLDCFNRWFREFDQIESGRLSIAESVWLTPVNLMLVWRILEKFCYLNRLVALSVLKNMKMKNCNACMFSFE